MPGEPSIINAPASDPEWNRNAGATSVALGGRASDELGNIAGYDLHAVGYIYLNFALCDAPAKHHLLCDPFCCVDQQIGWAEDPKVPWDVQALVDGMVRILHRVEESTELAVLETSYISDEWLSAIGRAGVGIPEGVSEASREKLFSVDVGGFGWHGGWGR